MGIQLRLQACLSDWNLDGLMMDQPMARAPTQGNGTRASVRGHPSQMVVPPVGPAMHAKDILETKSVQNKQNTARARARATNTRVKSVRIEMNP